MDLHSRKFTRRSLLRGVGAVALAMSAGPVLFNSKTAFAAPANVTTPPATADRSGTLILRPVNGVTAAQINARFGTQTVMTFSGTNQLLVWSPRVLLTRVQMGLAKQMVAWVELNTRVKSPRRRKRTGVGAAEDSGSDGTGGLQLLSDPAAYTGQWGVAKIRLAAAQQQSRGAGVV